MALNRRSFLQSSLALGVGAGIASVLTPASLAAASHRASVLEFGADPTGEKDSTAAVRSAIASLVINDARLVFPAGIYRFAASDEVAMQFNGFNGIELYANNAELFFSGNTVPFSFLDSKDVAVHDMKLDWDRPACSQGIVHQVAADSFTIDIDPAFPVTGTEPITGLAAFDPDTRRPSIEGLHPRNLSATADLLDSQRLRIHYPTSTSPIRPGMLLALFHAAPSPTRPSACFVLENCQGVLLEEIVVRHAPAAAFLLRGCRDLSMEGITVAATPAKDPASTPLLTALGDALHCTDCHGNILLKQMHLQGIAGDAINIYQSYFTISERLDDRTVVITGAASSQLQKWQLPHPGDFVQFSSPSLNLLGEIGINAVQATQSPSTHRTGSTLSFPETLSPVIVPGTLVCGVVDAPRISLDHSTITNTLGRGLVLHTRSEITNNHFQGCAQEAILLAPDSLQMQGPSVQNIRIRNNTFEQCNLSGKRGIISIDCARDQTELPTPQPAIALNSSIRVQGNTFIRSTGNAVYAASVDGLIISENTFGHAPADKHAPPPVAVTLRAVSNAELSNNISNMPQTITMTDCASTVEAQDNRQLTTSKQG